MEKYLKEIKPTLYKEALTHSSTGERAHNERLEFLGDAVLELVISEWLFGRSENFDEGRMSQIRSAFVREESLATAAQKLNLSARIKLGKGEEKSGGRLRPSLLADTLEAVLAAHYLSAGLEKTKEFIGCLFEEAMAQVFDENFARDYKSEFQETMQARGVEQIEYAVYREAGPAHSKTFWVELKVDNLTLAKGAGKTKKQAEQQAARNALENRLSD